MYSNLNTINAIETIGSRLLKINVEDRIKWYGTISALIQDLQAEADDPNNGLNTGNIEVVLSDLRGHFRSLIHIDNPGVDSDIDYREYHFILAQVDRLKHPHCFGQSK